MQKKSANLQLGNTGCQKAAPICKQKANHNMLRIVHKKYPGEDWTGISLTLKALNCLPPRACLRVQWAGCDPALTARLQSQFTWAQDHTARGSLTLFPHVCALSSFPCISSGRNEAVGKLEQFLELVIINKQSVLFFTMSFLAPLSDFPNCYIGIRNVIAKGALGEITAHSAVLKIQVIFVTVIEAK